MNEQTTGWAGLTSQGPARARNTQTTTSLKFVAHSLLMT